MPDIIAAILATEGLIWLIFAAALAGCVRGFSGFGSALVYLPIAGQFLPPVWVLVTLVMLDVLGPVASLRGAVRDGAMGDVARLMLAMVLALPLGLALLLVMAPEVFRYLVSGIALIVPVMLIAGLRYRGALTPPLVYGTGAASGFLGGVAGLPGPPVILLYMASDQPARVMRANTMLFLFGFDLVLMLLLAVQGRLEAAPVVLGLALALPSILGNLAGAAIFRPEWQRQYRLVAYAITIIAALTGLPLWD